MAKMTGLDPLLSSLGEESLQVRRPAVWLLATLHAGGLCVLILLCNGSFPPARTGVQEPCQAPKREVAVVAGRLRLHLPRCWPTLPCCRR